MSTVSVAGLDLSLSGAGVGLAASASHAAFYEVPQFQVHTVRSKGATNDSIKTRYGRLRSHAYAITSLVTIVDPLALVAVEGPSYGSTDGHSHERSGLWWFVVDNLRQMGVEVVAIPPTKVKMYATGKGNASKDMVLASMVRRYPDVPISTNDEADAWALTAMAARLAGSPIDDLPLTHLRAMDGLSTLEEVSF